MKLKATLFALVMGLSLNVFANPAVSTGNINSPDANHATYSDLAYAQNQDKAQTLDLYLPKNARNAPLVVYIHGGGWALGDKGAAAFNPVSGVHHLVKDLLNQGYAVASVNYRLSGQAAYPAALNDVQAALEFLRAHAKDYRIDPERIALTGDSAGGHLAQLAGALASKAQIRSVVSFYGVSDLRNVNFERIAQGCQKSIQSLMNDFMPSPITNTPEGEFVGEPVDSLAFNQAADKASPINHINAQTPPMMLLHGNPDCWVPNVQSKKIHSALQQLGVKSELVILEGAGHSDPKFFTTPQVTRQVLDFLKQTL